jgi:hypothetical protein
VIESFIKSNYQIVLWVIIIAAAFLIFFYFFRDIFSKTKVKKGAKEGLISERKEVIFELVKGKGEEGINEKEVSDFLGIKEKEAHRYLIELVRERKVIIDSDIGQVPRYKIL